MHELAITQALFDLALSEAEAAGVARVTGLSVQVGVLSGIDPAAVVFYFEMMSRNTSLAGVRIDFEKVMPVAHCLRCRHQQVLTAPTNAAAAGSHAWLSDYNSLICPNCAGDDFELVGGHEFALLSLEAE